MKRRQVILGLATTLAVVAPPKKRGAAKVFPQNALVQTLLTRKPRVSFQRRLASLSDSR